MANKYGAKQIMIDGHMFPSHREAEYYLTYKAMLDDGEIVKLELQPKFILIPAYTTRAGKKVRPCHYTADFLLTYPDGRKKVIEVKGFRTRDYMLRRKLFEYKFKEYEFEEVH
jgi:hypothetical protein